MNTSNDYLKTFRFYNTKNHRLSIFGKFNEQFNILTLWILTTSSIKHKETGKPLDTFSKRKAKELFDSYMNYKEGDEQPEVKPIIITISCTPTDYKKQFVQYCRENYNVKEKLIIGIVDSNKMILVDVYSNFIKGTTNPDATTLRMKVMPPTLKQENMYSDEQVTEAFLRMFGDHTKDSEASDDFIPNVIAN